MSISMLGGMFTVKYSFFYQLIHFFQDDEVTVVQNLCSGTKRTTRVGSKSHHRPRLTLFSDESANQNELFLEPPMTNPTVSKQRLQWPMGKISKLKLDWRGHDAGWLLKLIKNKSSLFY